MSRLVSPAYTPALHLIYLQHLLPLLLLQPLEAPRASWRPSPVLRGGPLPPRQSLAPFSGPCSDSPSGCPRASTPPASVSSHILSLLLPALSPPAQLQLILHRLVQTSTPSGSFFFQVPSFLSQLKISSLSGRLNFFRGSRSLLTSVNVRLLCRAASIVRREWGQSCPWHVAWHTLAPK